MVYKKAEKRKFWILEVTLLRPRATYEAVLHQEQKYSLRSANPTPEQPRQRPEAEIIGLSKFPNCGGTLGIQGVHTSLGH